MSERVEITVDGQRLPAVAGATLLTELIFQGVAVPHLCYHPALSAPAHCRLCVALVGQRDHRQLITTCNTTVRPGMIVDTASDEVVSARESALEFTLIDHAMDCPVCPKSGECDLQEFSFQHGRDDGRYDGRAAAAVDRIGDRIGDRIVLDHSRCIQCSRCIRFCEEVAGTNELTVVHGEGVRKVGVFPGAVLDNPLSGNTVDVCPTGALMDSESHGNRPVWQLRGTDSVCPRCASGCNVRIDVADGRIQRLKPRANAEVNQYWMCDEGRYGWDYVHSDERLTSAAARRDGQLAPASWDAAVHAAHELIAAQLADSGPETMGVLLSSWMTNEEAYLLARLARERWKVGNAALCTDVAPGGDVHFPGGFTIRGDKGPNGMGVRQIAAAVGLHLEEPQELLDRIAAGRLSTVVAVGGWPDSPAGVEIDPATLNSLSGLVVLDILPSAWAAAADIVLAGASFAEKDGTYTNADGAIQRFHAALSPPGTARPECDWLAALCERFGMDGHQGGPAAILPRLGRLFSSGPFAGISHEVLEASQQMPPRTGQVYGGGWATQLQRLDLLRIEDHTKTTGGRRP